jgi:YggT family protein
MGYVVLIIHYAIRILILVLVIQAVLSYFMSPFDPRRQKLDRFVEPMLAPIRRILPQTGMFDFSPLVLIILLQVLDMILLRIF